MRIKVFRLIAVSLITSHAVIAYDLPVFYRAPQLEGQPGKSTSDWYTQLSISYLQGSTNHAWNDNGKKTAPLNTWGILDVTRLGLGVQDKQGTLETYWNNDGDGTFDELLAAGTLGPDDGKVSISSHFETKELSLEARQNILLGLYIYTHAPIRSVKQNDITFKHLGTDDVFNFSTFLNGGDFETILSEYGYEQLTSPYSKTEFSDVLVGVGWQGKDSTSFEVIDSLNGGGEIGITCPAGSLVNERHASALPTGYNGHWGVKANVGGEVGFWKFLAVGASTNATIFFPEEHIIRMKTDESQKGILALDKGHAQVDRGTLWRVNGYLKATVAKAFSFLAGASFSHQEKTWLDVRDNHFLKRVIDNSMTPDDEGLIGPLTSKDHIVNSDERLQVWEMYTVHFKAAYDMREKMKSAFAPAVNVEYSCPVAGKHVLINDIVSGTLDACLEWKF